MIPITIIAGYLGSGKTTLINRVLASTQDVSGLAVLVNDFGDINIDAGLISSQSETTNVIGLQNGCVCCSVKNELSESLEELLELGIDRIVLEASGVGLPSKIKQQCAYPGFENRGCVVLVDAANHTSKLSDKYVGPLVTQQVEQADQLALTKLDLNPTFVFDKPHVSLDQIEEWIISDGPNAMRGYDTPASTAPAFAATTLRATAPLRVQEFLATLPSYVERAKGYLPALNGAQLIQYTAAHSQVEPANARRHSHDYALVVIYPEKNAGDFKRFLRRAVLEFPLVADG